MSVPFALKRPWLLARGVRTSRDEPSLPALAAIDDPERFVWAMLPHAARSFAPSILMLPVGQARVAAAGYLYCRMLDTYEDLSEPGDVRSALRAFADRMEDLSPPPDPPTRWRDQRDRVHLLLLERYDTVDRFFLTLPPVDRARIVELVRAMADGMIWSVGVLQAQGGVLVDDEQVRRYCQHVIGEPAVFTLMLTGGTELSAAERHDAMSASVLIQLANITRDIERDLVRGIGYHPSLRALLGESVDGDLVRNARRDLMAQALPHVSSYLRLAEQRSGGRFSLARAAAVVMLLFTDRHYRWCASQVGIDPWRGPGGTTAILLASLPAALSGRWAGRLMRRVERDFLDTAAVLA